MEQDELQSRQQPVREYMGLQRKVWRLERLGWYVLVVTVLLTLGGLFSKGPLSSRQLHSADGRLQVHYQALLRGGSAASLVVHMRGSAGQPLELEVGGELLQGFSVESLLPQPLKASAVGQGLRLWLLADADGRASLHLRLRSEGAGRYATRVALAAGPALTFEQFIYP